MENDDAEDQNVYMTINLMNKNCKQLNERDPLKDYSEINAKYLKFFFGTWVKYIEKETKEYNTGGILTEINYQFRTIYLRTLSQGPMNVIKLYPLEKYKYYVKNTTENYRAYTNIKNEYEKIKLRLISDKKVN